MGNYIGRSLDKISNIEILDNITFDGSSSYNITKSSVAFTPNSAQSCLISIDGVVQATNFTVSSSTIDFGVAVPSTSTCNFFLHYGTGVAFVPSDGSVSTAKLGDGSVTSAKLSSGKVLQVQSTTKTDTFSSSTTDSFVEVTGLNVNITPSSTSSKILISGIVGIGHTSGTNGVYMKVQRGSTDIGIGDANSSNPRSMAGSDVREYQIRQLSMNFLDSPNTTSQINYKVLILSPNSTMSVNKDGEDGSGDNHTRTISTITVMEISA
jgi:hypothetical protein